MTLRLSDCHYEYLVPPKDVYNVSHTDHYIRHGKGKSAVRTIFANQKYEDEENAKLKELEALLIKEKVQLPPEWTQIDSLKALYAAKQDCKKAVKGLKQHLEWRMSPERGKISAKGIKAMEDGIMYISGRDKQYRPIIVINVYKVDPKKMDLNDFIEVICFVFDLAKKYYFVPGKVENWITFMEINNAGVFDIPMKVVKTLIEVTSANYTASLHRLYIMNPSSFLKRAWLIVRSLIDPETVQKIQMYTKSDFPQLLENISKDQLEQIYGGSLPTKEVYWPPINTLDPNLYEKEKEKEKEPLRAMQTETDSLNYGNTKIKRSQTRQTKNGDTFVEYKRTEKSDVMSTYMQRTMSNAHDTRITDYNHQLVNKTTGGTSKKYSENGNRILHDYSETDKDTDMMHDASSGNQESQRGKSSPSKNEGKSEGNNNEEEEEPAYEGTPEQYAMMKWHRKMSKKLTMQNEQEDSSPSQHLLMNHGTLSLHDDFFDMKAKRQQKKVPNVTFGGVEVNDVSRYSAVSINNGSKTEGLVLEGGNILEQCGGMCRPRTTPRARHSQAESCNIF